MTERNIQIVKPSKACKSRGAKAILVDGELWGFAVMVPIGRRGVKYHFMQARSVTDDNPVGCYLAYEGERRWKGSNSSRFYEYTVYSDKIAERQRRGDEPPIGTLDERMTATVRKMLDAGHFMHPDAVAEKTRKANEKYRAARAEAEAEREKKLRSRAFEAIFPSVLASLSKDDREDQISRVVEAMKDAQQW